MLCLLNPVENRFRSDVLLNFFNLVIHLRLDPDVSGDVGHHGGQFRHFVLGEKANLQVEIGSLVGSYRHSILANEDERGEEDRLTEAIMARTTNDGSHLGTPGTQPRLAMIQNPNAARCK